jgi:ABC-type phosphate transport system substrate-binding protein
MFKKTLLVAASVMTLASTGAFAAGTPKPPVATNNNYGAVTLKGNGASSIANVLVQELNCLGGNNNNLGLNDNTSTNLPEHVYSPAKTTAANRLFDCNSESVHADIQGQYVSTGSGDGRADWKNLNAAAIPDAKNPFTTGADDWTNIHFAFSDAAISSTELGAYNSAAKPTAGAAIQVPMFVLPVAVAYSPVYGKKKLGDGTVVELKFHLKTPRADGTGGLRLKKTTYCGIFNGTITNFNDPAITADNGGVPLFDTTNDTASRWSSAGVPIKLVGRQEKSGTTNIFTRHLTAACGGGYTAGGTDLLPTGRISVAAGTDASGGYAEATYNKTTGALLSGESEVPGKFGVVNGSDGVAHAIAFAPADPVNNGDVTLNGHFGYVGADWVAPATISASLLHSADLQMASDTTGKKFYAPTAANATLSFKGILPPQSDAKGKYNTTPATGALTGNRNDPLAWVLPASVASNPLAQPVNGYPIVGTTNMLLYTCYANADVRKAVQAFAELHLGKLTVGDNIAATAKVPAKLVTNVAKSSDGLPTGILARNGIAPLPAQWVNAINETFFTKVVSGNNPGALNLWIQDKLPKKASDVTVANPNCTANVGA